MLLITCIYQDMAFYGIMLCRCTKIVWKLFSPCLTK